MLKMLITEVKDILVAIRRHHRSKTGDLGPISRKGRTDPEKGSEIPVSCAKTSSNLVCVWLKFTEGRGMEKKKKK